MLDVNGHGYRSNNRYMVFQVLEHTLGFESAMMRGDLSNLSERKLMDCLNRLG